ncbi:ATP-dependent RNA helicase HrpA [Planosporangium flavigriseum]|uniref:RNA helicase n=1 Tax=Planosporangium flavigriseum TaxID=373681 RepID=A0A8J3LPJ2_9ACTN|nr:ATP-dependent RNA helicase HrpA [Planosporangium flavigriseum]NJC67113.1 ATP-dependent RNA helicase HrpA [Planosporangium flavigriseum]GIG75517.1 ATP-dependent helicase [Planosporangium flavigriseum]
MPENAAPSPLADLQARLPDLMLRDQRRLRRRIDGVRKIRKSDDREAVAAQIAAEIETAEQRVALRRESVPAIRYPEALPVSQKKDDILAAIRDHQVVIVAGETGSGKTTQLPKICLELGRGITGLIGHTQPRRLAARTVADRIADELGTESTVGFKMRFTDQTRDDTLVKLMTDGILLAELSHDRMLWQYDTLIIDEAHERSLNIDFILGYLKQLLPKRPDLKVIITSATIDPERFSNHFNEAPIIEVSGRTYPVEVRYRPLIEEAADPEETDEVRDQIQAIGDAVGELAAEGPGDILVFLSGEREIRDTADALTKMDLRNTEIVPLYARLSSAEQHRVFQPHTGRRVVLATNVAETSLTVPGIKYVIDPGTARISRYSHRTKVQRLPIEPISQASANQRKGRCGRTSDGICIRLYSEEDFLGRPEFTDPEILRTNLASVILQMTSLGLGDVAAFPFIDGPDRRNIRDGVDLLHELGALDGDKLTATGRKLAQLPVDPRLGRMVLEAERNGCVHEVMVIAAALSIQDPRERPADRQEAATQAHARFVDSESDFLTYLNLWNYLREQQKELSSNQFRRMCKKEFLNFLRVREWQDIYLQVRQVMKNLGVTVHTDTPAEGTAVHQSLLAGLLGHLGIKDVQKQQDYLGARGAKFAIFPGSALFKKQPRWVMSAELVETSRLWARVNAKIEPEWAEKLAGHLVKRSYSEPHWEKKQGAVMAYEKVTLYGLPLVAQRKVNFGRVDPPLARELFIRHALVEGDWQTHHEFFHENRSLLAEVEDLENRARRRDILVDDETLFEFYDKRLPADVVSGRHFDAWWKKARRTDADLLNFEKSMLINDGAGGISEGDYPDVWVVGDLRLRLTYQFEPGTEADGVTVHVPLPVLARVPAEPFEWQVPGLRKDLVTALIRSLPKPVRRNFVPVPDFAADALTRLTPGNGPLLAALERELHYLGGVAVPHSAWDLSKVPEHLRMTFRVEDEHGKKLAEGKDVAALRQQLKPQVQETISAAAVAVEKRGLRSFEDVPRTVRQVRAGYEVTAYPALVDAGESVDIRVFDSEAEQQAAMWLGTRRLLQLTVPSPVKVVNARLTNHAKLGLSRNPHRSAADLIDDCVTAALDKLMADAGGPAWDSAGFERLRDFVRAGLADTVFAIVTEVQPILGGAYAVEKRLSGTANLALVPALTDMRAQLSRLIYRGFVTDTGWDYLGELPRYLKAIEYRLDRVGGNLQRDRQHMVTVDQVWQEYEQLRTEVPDSPGLRRIRWMVEELRVSLFAQALGTPHPVSDKRIYRAMDEL